MPNKYDINVKKIISNEIPTPSHNWKLLFNSDLITSLVVAIMNIKIGVIIGMSSIVRSISLLDDFDDITPKNEPTTEYPTLNTTHPIISFNEKIFKLNRTDEIKKITISEIDKNRKKTIDFENKISSLGTGITNKDCNVLFCSS
ncbi:MAG: hypothetical protein VXW63_01220 [Chloroflexota bacterium]|nr:hypothetical protein [Chloroflexota bacterium]